MRTVDAPTELPVEADPVIVRRYYPAEVTLTDQASAQVITGALVIVTQERVYVWTAADSVRSLRLSAAYERPDDAPPLPREYELKHRPALLDTDFGPVTVNKGRGCGCGNPLKSWRPFTPERQARG